MRSQTKLSSLYFCFLLIEILILIRSSVCFIDSPWKILRRSQNRYLLSTPLKSRSKHRSAAPAPCRSQTNYRCSFSTTTLFGQYKNNGQRQQSIFRSLLNFSLKINDSDGESRIINFGSKKKNPIIETGLETALVLGNKKRRIQWTRDVSKQFPWIPSEILLTCVAALATSFASVTPKDLKKALRPGGLDKARSKIETDVVRNLQRQPIIQQLPLPKDDKNKVLTHLVNFSLDFFLKDIESILAAPSEKLRVLDQERREIQKYMSFWQLSWYRLRYKPKMTIIVGLLSLSTVYSTYIFYRQHQIVIQVKQSMGFLFSSLKGMCAFKVFRVRNLRK